MYRRRDGSARLQVSQRDQTTARATFKIMCREEVGPSLQGPTRFLLRRRLQLGNNRHCSVGAFSAMRRGLGVIRGGGDKQALVTQPTIVTAAYSLYATRSLSISSHYAMVRRP
jgi:hypothetical protein